MIDLQLILLLLKLLEIGDAAALREHHRLALQRQGIVPEPEHHIVVAGLHKTVNRLFLNTIGLRRGQLGIQCIEFLNDNAMDLPLARGVASADLDGIRFKLMYPALFFKISEPLLGILNVGL